MPDFTIQTVPNGHNSGRLFIFGADSPALCAEAMGKITAALEAADAAQVFFLLFLISF